MRLLLDTHVWLWRLLAPERISDAAERALSDGDAELCLSPISVWEALVLARKGRVRLDPTPAEWVLEALRRSAPAAVPLTHAIAMRSEAMTDFEAADPADRFLAATALEHDLTLVTADRALRDYQALATVW